MTISGNRDPRWTDDLQAITFGIHIPRLRDTAAGARENTDDETRDGEERPDTGGSTNATNSQANDERVDLVLWHWLDSRLQSQQEVQEGRDRTFSYLAVYRADTKKFIRLADEDLRTVDIAPKQRWAVGFDDREYELVGNLDGRRFQDVYVIDMQTGQRRLAAKRARWFNGVSPDGNSFLAYEDGNYQVYPMAGGQPRNITQAVPTSFVDSEDDHNIVKPPTGAIGWASDSQSVLLHDNWDVWQVPVDAGTAVNLTQTGRKDQVRFQRRFALEPIADRAKGIDLAKPLYFAAYGEWTKKAGIARVSPGKPGAELLMWDDAAFGTVMKPEQAERLIFAKATATDPSDFYVSDLTMKEPRRLTDQRPQVAHVCVDGRLDADQLHERQGGQAAGGAVPARRLREGQEVPDDREHLREDVAGREPVRESRRRTASTARSTPATATPCCCPTSPTR